MLSKYKDRAYIFTNAITYLNQPDITNINHLLYKKM